MPEETTTVETTTDPAGETPEQTMDPNPKPDSDLEDEFDAERAKKLIDKLRPFEKEAGRLKKELDAANKKLKAIDDEKLSETERLQNRVNELEPIAESAANLEQQLERSNKALSTYVEKLRDGLPQSVLVLLDKSDVAEQLEWLTANRDEVIGGGKTDEKPPTKGVPATPKANASGIPDDERRKRAAVTWRG